MSGSGDTPSLESLYQNILEEGGVQAEVNFEEDPNNATWSEDIPVHTNYKHLSREKQADVTSRDVATLLGFEPEAYVEMLETRPVSQIVRLCYFGEPASSSELDERNDPVFSCAIYLGRTPETAEEYRMKGSVFDVSMEMFDIPVQHPMHTKALRKYGNDWLQYKAGKTSVFNTD